MARVSIWKLNPLIDVLQLENWYMEFPVRVYLLVIRMGLNAFAGPSEGARTKRACLED